MSISRLNDLVPGNGGVGNLKGVDENTTKEVQIRDEYHHQELKIIHKRTHLTDNVLVRVANTEPVLGGVVLVLVLGNKTGGGKEERLSSHPQRHTTRGAKP